MRFQTASLLTSAFVLGACAAPTVDPDAEREAIRARGAGVVAAEVAEDTQAALAFWAPDAIAQGHGIPQAQGHEEIAGVYAGFFAAVDEFGSTTTRIDVAASGDMAWEYGINRAVVAGPDGPMLDMGKYVGVWRKLEGEWYLVAVAFTSDAPAPAPVQATAAP